jgi:hypothetical protein
MSRVQINPPFQRGLKGMPEESLGGTPKPISKILMNFGVRHWKSPSRLCECEQDILSGPCGRSSPDGIDTVIIRTAMIGGWRIPGEFTRILGTGPAAFEALGDGSALVLERTGPAFSLAGGLYPLH